MSFSALPFELVSDIFDHVSRASRHLQCTREMLLLKLGRFEQKRICRPFLSSVTSTTLPLRR
jgi:hypothetical protein